MTGEDIRVMLLSILSGLPQLLSTVFGVFVALRPPKHEHHWWVISIFVVFGFAGIVAGYKTESSQKNLIDKLAKSNAYIATFGPKLDQIIKQPASEKQSAVALKEEVSRRQSPKTRVDPKQAVYDRAMDLSDRIGVVGEEFGNELDDLLHEKETGSVGPQGFKIRMDQVHKRWIDLYEQKYRNSALLARPELLEYVPDVPIFGHLGMGEAEYLHPICRRSLQRLLKSMH